MKFYLSDKSFKLTWLNRKKHMWYRIVSTLACIVVFCTTYALILPAITLSEEYYCGKTEHEHTEECYFYETTKILICEQPEKIVHEHTEECYITETTYDCDKTEDVVEVVEVEEEVSGSEETFEMAETTDESAQNETVEKKVVTKPHEHTEECNTKTEKILICEKPEVEEHIHTEQCYQTVQSEDATLVCELEEHEHERICSSDKSADLETKDIWENTLPKEEEFSGIIAEDLILVAKSQLGYKESTRNFEVNENGDAKGYTRYGQWYGVPYGDWCAMYVSFCLNYAQIPEEVIPYEAGCQNWIDKLEDLELYRKAEEYEPVPGDIVFFGTKEGDSNHVGIVTEVRDAKIKTIEGNSSDKVKENTYNLKSESANKILGYGSIEAVYKRGVELGLLLSLEDEIEDTVPTLPEEDGLNDAVENTDNGLEVEYEDMQIRLQAQEGAFDVPLDEVALSVTEPDETMKSALDKAIGNEIPYYAVDIQIMHGDKVIQPLSTVEVVFEMNNDPLVGYEEVEIYHAVYDKENNNLTVQEVEGERNSDGDVVMRTNHFSTYVVSGAETESGVAMYAARAATPTNTWQEALTDRSGNIGVASEGYTDSPYTKTRKFASENITAVGGDGGTAYLGKKIGGVYHTDPYYAERYWDGKAPVRITRTFPDKRATLTKTVYADWFLEDNKAPNAPLKIDNVHLETHFAGWNLYGRGNKIVIGENVTTKDGKKFRIYGGSDTNNSTTSCPTNVVVESGNWYLVCGGGHGNIPNGTTVTVRGDANISYLYGGGTERSTVGTPDGQNTDVNIYIEGGNVGLLYGGNRVENNDDAIYEDINIEVSGGNIGVLQAGNDYSYMNNIEDAKASFVQGNATVRLTNSGSATKVFGDPQHTALTRTIWGAAILEVYCDEDFELMDYWDVVRIIGDGTVNSTTVHTKLTTGGGYIGRMEVNNGGRLYLSQNGYINVLNERDQTLTPRNSGSTPYELKHAWQGESTEERRNLSTLAIEGAAITPSGNYYFDQEEGKAGLRIKGNVEGFSTLEACGTPMYSTGDTYYYYVVADSSDNGGKAFREPEGAPYVVCYRYLEDGRIGWYLRERPVLTMTNSLVRVGTEGTLTPTENGVYTEYPANYVIMHVDMKGFAYEWSSTPGKNRVDFSWTIFDGYENATAIPGGISVQTMADIENKIYSTSNPNGIFTNVKYEATGSDEGSTEQTKRVSSFDVIIDTSKAVNPRYYDVSSSFHYTRGKDNYDDLRVGQTVDAARCTYDFDKEGTINEGLPSDGYANSIMTTYEYKDGIPPKGADDALLRVYLPEGVSANTLTVKELNEQFTFEKTGTAASLVSNSQVATYYSTKEESTYNHKFGVTLQQTGASEIDLAGGATLNYLSGKETYHCAVYSHEKISFTDITPESNLGLQLQLQLKSLTKGGNAVGNGDPSAVNDGELRIQVLPVGTIVDTTTIFVEKIVTDVNVAGDESEFKFLLSYPKINENGQNVTHEERFTLKHGGKQSIIVPLGTEITIQEINHDGYHVQVGKPTQTENENSDTVVITTPDKEHLTGEELKVIFYNTPGIELPLTGGPGTSIYTILGLLLMSGAVLLLWMHRRERRIVG